MDKKNPLVIVITDEVGSTPRDEDLRKKKDEQEITEEEYKDRLLKSRQYLFSNQIRGLTQPTSGWTVVKTVGDSLIISLKPNSREDVRDNLLECLDSLLKVWKEFGRELRVACHLTYLEDILTGKKELEPLKQSIQRSSPESVILDPILTSIESDIFGSAMNLAARLASIPKEGLFVVSQEVMEEISTSKYLREQIILKRVPFELKFSSNKMIGWAYPVPVINVKGFAEKYTTPMYVWEIVLQGSEKEYRSLRVQFKEFQSLKVVVASYKAPIVLDKNHPWEEDACTTFENRLKDNPCPLFIDFVLELKNQHQLFDPNMLRDFDHQLEKLKQNKRNWQDVLIEVREKGDLIPYYVMFTTVPDIESNKKLRYFFTPKDENKDESWTFQHISFDIYESLKVEYEEEKTFKKYFLLLFQIQKKHANKADDWKRFFKEKDSSLLSIYPVDRYHTYTTIACGLIKGEIDGFVLFASDSGDNNCMGTLEEYITTDIIQGKFFSKMAPIFLYDLKLIPPFPFPENIKDIITIRNIHDKERYK